MGDTKIEWTDKVWNPVTGCTKVSAGCANCYAERMHGRFSDRPFSEIVLHCDRLDQPFRWRKPRRIFVCSMGDLFHEDVPESFIYDVLGVIVSASRHTFMVLTKRPGRMLPIMAGRILPMPSNLWLGVSVENQAAADERIPLLLQTPAAVRFLSVEPMLGPVNFGKVPGFNRCGSAGADMLRNLWVICGGESGPSARPMHPEWARSLRDQCVEAGVPFFFKQLSKKAEIPGDLMIREFPQERRSSREEGA